MNHINTKLSRVCNGEVGDIEVQTMGILDFVTEFIEKFDLHSLNVL